MQGHSFSAGVASSTTWRFALFTVAACAATATLLVAAVPQKSTQQWAQVASVRGSSLQTTAAVPTSRMGTLAQNAQVVRQAAVPVMSESIAQGGVSYGSTGLAATMAGVGVLFISAAVAMARTLLTSKPEALALLSTSGEKASESKDKMRKLVDTLDPADIRLLSRGGSMQEVVMSKGIDEVAVAIKADQARTKDLSPKDVILEMQRGNGRFWMGITERPDMSAMQRRALILAQAPKICILSCSDSRVPVEIVFDQGLGEVFVVRMAGNILDVNAHGSIEYGVKYLGVKVVMVMGHEGCGAVKGAISLSNEDIAKESVDLQFVLNSIKGGLDLGALNNITDQRSRDREAIVLNTSNQVKALQENPLIKEKVADGSLLVCGAFYEISSGIVDLFSLDKNGFVVDM